MAPIKRKAQTEERDVKRSKPDASGTAPIKKRQPTESKEQGDRNPVKASILSQEERAFPRGGASVLTPLEHKQIKIQAERDVLFEQSGGKKQKPDNYSDDDDEDADAGADSGAAPKKKRKTKADKRAAKAAEDDKPQIKIHGLSYKNITVGTLVLGQVTDITSRDVALALPNNLTGFIPLTAISEKVNQKIEALLAQADEDVKDESEDEDDDDLDLKSLFHVGQWLRAIVTSTADETAVNGLRKSKKRIELSVDPKQANIGLDSSNLPVHSTLQASVRSVEDHGLVMDLGLDDESVRGFVSKKELGKIFDISKIHEGQVMLCVVTGKASDNKVIKLAPDFTKMGDINKHCLSDAPTIDAFLPGTAVEVLVTESSRGGIATKVMGMLDATADVIHSGAGARVDDVSKKYKIGSKVKARVICTFHSAENKKLGISFLDHVKTFKAFALSSEKKADKIGPSSIVEDAQVVHVEPAMGLFLKLSGSSNPGFAHISRISDKKIDNLSETIGQYKLESTHRARVLGFNPIDAVYNVSLEQKILDQPFLRIEDVEVGQIVKATVMKIILGAKGVTGVLVQLADGIDGLVPESHMSDVKLQHPEKKFREGFPVTARVLTVDPEKNQIRLTLKKTLVNTEAKIWKSYEDINVGDEAPGTIINIKPNGAVVQFYGKVRAWLPVAEMSEAYISDPSQHFRQGQTVMVHALSVDAEADELKVSCKDASAFGKDEESAWNELKEGQLINASVTEVTGESVMLDLEGSNLKGTLRLTHLTDGSEAKNKSTMKQIRVGQKLNELVVVEKLNRRHLVILSNKPSLVKAASSKTLVSQFKSLSQGQEVAGFVRNITPDGVFVEFAAGLVGFMPKTQITQEKLALPAFGLRKDQSITTRVLSVNQESKRFVLTIRPEEKKEEKPQTAVPTTVTNPVDGVSTSLTDFTLGKETQARIVSIKDTQLNVLLADNIQGRIDVSEVFNSWEDIKDRKKPLQKFKAKQVLPVKVLGIHDARNHRFLPITHRHSRVPVLELTAKTNTSLKSESDVLTLDQVKVDSTWIAYVNNIGDKCLWANLSPNVRGRIDLLDVSDDVSLLQDIPKNFPIGSAIRVKVKSVNAAANRLDLVAASAASSAPVTLKTLTEGQILAGKVTKVSERNVIVQLSDSVSGIVTLTELSDDFTEANPTTHSRGDIVRVCVSAVDAPNKRVYLSMRPSKVLSSALPVEDRQITSIPQLVVNDVVRGFVKAVTEKGVIVNLGPRIDAFVRISDLSDSFVKEWKSAVEIDQLVKGKILQVDANLNHVQMSLKQSHVDKDYVPANSFADLKIGQFVTGKVRKVEDFGVFIDVDNTIPRVSGLCHKSQIADSAVEDVKKLYDAGDLVKAKVLHIDTEKRRISFGLKASYFKDLESDEEMEDDDEEDESEGEGVPLADDSESDDGVDIDMSNVQDMESEEEAASDEEMSEDEAPTSRKSILGGLTTSGFDWSGAAALDNDGAISDAEEASAPLKKRKRKAAIQVDQTGDLDANGPQSVADFERMLLTSPSDSSLWIQYMAFQLGLSEVQKARDIGQRALRTIHLREQDEKQNIWVALLNLEVAYGDADSVESTFKESCKVQDSFTMHEKLAAIYTSSGDFRAAEKIFDQMASTKSFRPNPNLWLNYATFLFEKRNAASQARALLPRALQSVASHDHRNLTAKFAALEFRTSTGEPERARTIFESMLTQWTKWTQGWDMWCDLERSLSKISGKKEDVERVRGLFERMANGKMKKRRARFVFKRWLEFEEEQGDAKHVDAVKARAKAFVEKMQNGGEDEDMED
ncbi:nucleic acid-binding protein [Aureobasidium pullulans]|nr:nucleic acid-binding protein [Aureobasidium pullulans]